MPVSSPANPAFSATANDFTLAPPDTVHTSPGASDAASPSEGLTDKQLAQLENGRPQQDGAEEGAAEEPDSPPEDNGTSAPAKARTAALPAALRTPGNPERFSARRDGFVYYRQDWSEYKTSLTGTVPSLLRLRTDQHGDDNILAHRQKGLARNSCKVFRKATGCS